MKIFVLDSLTLTNDHSIFDDCEAGEKTKIRSGKKTDHQNETYIYLGILGYFNSDNLYISK